MGPDAVDRKVSEIARQVQAIEEAEKRVAETIWADELQAQRSARIFEDLWDRLNSATNKLDILAAFAVDEIASPALGSPELLACGIHLYNQVGNGDVWASAAWRRFIRNAQEDGWQLDRVEFRHLQFDVDLEGEGQPARSRFYCSAHLTNPSRVERAVLDGNLRVAWEKAADMPEGAFPRRIEAAGFSVRTRQGEPGFREFVVEQIAPPSGSHFIDPLIVYDLDGDGFSEIILAAANLVIRRAADGEYFREPFCRHPPGLIFTGIIGDFDGDGAADFLCAKFDGLVLIRGSPAGRFDAPGELVWAAEPRLKYPQALTCGDVDGDGDLDVWLGQYKVPYNRGQMPTPFYDANDGHPSFLLLNNGTSRFSDGTVDAGVSRQRWRRAYSASLVDINEDGHLDLITANDFAGLELFSNLGSGRFTNVTSQLLPESRGFGMSQICSDLDSDGRLDLLMIGMNVPVADRLLNLGRARAGYEKYLAMTGPMVYGNRLFIAQGDGRFRQTALNESIARTGWSWGCSALDLDNDGHLELAVVNGHESKQSVRDYEPEFWLHDIYVGNSHNDLAAFTYFRAKAMRTRGNGMSYGGYEKNRLYLNDRGKRFVEIAHLMGIGLEEDSRNVVADDLDNNGQLDLLVTTFEVWPQVRQTLRLFMNVLESESNWIGFRLREQGRGVSPVGAKITIHYGGRTAVRQVVAGDSFRAQSANKTHFGLGEANRIEKVEIRWINGREVVLEGPELNRYHEVLLP